MKTKIVGRLIVLGVGIGSGGLLMGPERVGAQVWEVDDGPLQYSAGKNSVPWTATAGSDGSVIVGGNVLDETGRQHALTRCRLADGSWLTIDDYLGPESTKTDHRGAIASPEGLFLFANASRPAGGRAWICRVSNDSGVTWTEDDVLQSADDSVVVCVGTGSDGSLYAAGILQNHIIKRKGYTTENTFLVRRRPPGGEWGTVFPGTPGAYAEVFSPSGLSRIVCAGPSVYIIGTLGSACTLLKSQDNGQSWIIEDSFRLSEKHPTGGAAVSIDSSGTLYVTGSGQTGSGKTLQSLGFLRRKTISGPWETSLFPVASLFPRDVVVNAAGGVHITGYYQDSQGLNQWVNLKWSGANIWDAMDVGAPYSSGNALVIAPSGLIYNVGSDRVDSSGYRWVVRRLTL